MPQLGDALQQAGCEDEPFLAHCRGPEEHVRGCWVIDLILGKQWADAIRSRCRVGQPRPRQPLARALRLSPDYTEAHNNLGATLRDLAARGPRFAIVVV